MGDRISIQFENKGDPLNNRTPERSVAFFDHWDGREIIDWVHQFNEEVLLKRIEQQKKFPNFNDPIDRMEPRTVMVAFIAWLFRGPEKESIPTHNFYLGADANDGDNSDNGNVVFVVEQDRGIVTEYTEES